MEANDKDSKIETKVRNEKGATEHVHRRDKELSHRSISPQSSIRWPSKLQVSALAKPGIASLSMQSIFVLS